MESAEVWPSQDKINQFTATQAQDSHEEVSSLITKLLLTSTSILQKQGWSEDQLVGWPCRKAIFVEVDQDLSVDQEGKLLSWMVEFLLWLK